MDARTAWRDWCRIGRVLRRERVCDGRGWPQISLSHTRLRPEIPSGRPQVSRIYHAAINAPTLRMRWLARCWLYGRIPIREAKAQLQAAGIPIDDGRLTFSGGNTTSAAQPGG